MKQMTANLTATKTDLFSNFFNAKTMTRNKVNTTAVNNLCLALSANSITKKKIEANDLTFSIDKMSAYIVDKLNVISAYHKKDSPAIFKRLQSKNSYDIKTNAVLNKDCKKISACRIRNHCKDHMRILKDFENVLTDIDVDKMTVTFHADFVKVIQNDKQIRKHVKALTSEVKNLALSL